ncbi:hypothetical protein ACFWHT_07225 [Microbacterium sp. NPDC058342]|uniref:hypothetical protein n=1 Tax=Microbacterium sp. NPDC058342 TaxID=3346454 RepID=UPI00365A589E
MRKRTVVIDQDDEAPFWLEHIGALIVIGVVVLVAGFVFLPMTDWGRATLVGLGAGLAVLLTAWLAVDPWRSVRSGEPVSVWGGEAVSALGWGGMTFSLAAGLPYIFWLGPPDAPEWLFFLPGAGAVLFTAVAALGIRMQTRRPLSALDLRPRPAHVILNTQDADGGQIISVRYRGADGDEHEADLADLIDDSSLARRVQARRRASRR